MNTYLYKAINKYFRTLTTLGSINKQEEYKLFMVSTLYNIYKVFFHRVTKTDVELFNKYIECHIKNSCLFDKIVPCLSYNTETNDSLITIIDSDIITTIAGVTQVASNRTTQKFTDFEVRTEIQGDNYVVGYDASDNKEVAVNVNDLGVFWDVDI